MASPKDPSQSPSGWMSVLSKYRGLIVPVSFVLLLGVILVPLPAWLMDGLISINISLATVILLTTLYMHRPLDFSVFPSILLATTLLRLVLNIASTRLILTAEASSPEEAIGVAGKVISAFGNFVAGDSLFVGIVIFLILVIVQFVVVTKGATRISEVAARFTLDALPGKQMAIDADVAAGTITEEQAREQRDLIRREADFFGAMDGASKFVRGDATAGIIITVLNILGGFAVGAIERGWPAGQTAEVFTRLTIGDGITSALPSFIISIAAALIVTRSSAKEDLGTELTSQLSSQPTGLFITSGFLAMLAITPLPTVPLLATSVGIAIVAFLIGRATRTRASEAREVAEREAQAAPVPENAGVEQALRVDLLELEVGYGLVGLVDSTRGGDLLDRITATREQLASELGLVMPPVRIRDNMQLAPNEYRVKIRGAPVARSEVVPERLLAMDPGLVTGPIEGLKTTEPAFGLDAWWIDPALQPRAEQLNYTVVDPPSVVATHLAEITKNHAEELLTREEVNNLVEQLKARAPRLVEETIPAVVKPHELQRILQNLLRERVPIRDLESILEVLSEWGGKTKDADVLTEYVRNGLRRAITQQYAEQTPEGAQSIACLSLDPAFEDRVESYIDRSTGSTTVTMPAGVSNALTRALGEALGKLTAAGHHPVVVASPPVRAVVRQLAAAAVPNAAVLGFNELAPGVEVESVGLVTLPEEPAPVAPSGTGVGEAAA